MHDDSPDRLSASLESLNARIARLAIGLGVDLSDPAALATLMALPPQAPVAVERRIAGLTTTPASAHAGGDRRVSHLRQELRGLVTLRYHVESLSVAEIGITATRLAMVQAHQQLMAHGFKAGADGETLPTWPDFNELP